MNTQTRLVWAVLNTVGLAVALVCNGLANALPLNGMGTGKLSDLYPNLFVPAGLTFSIWGLIYLWLLAFVGYGFRLYAKARERNPLARIGPWFLINTLANAAWIFAWHWQQVELALGLMVVILASLVAMYLRLGIGRVPAPAAERWLVHAPISIYLGWITVATIANVTTLAIAHGVAPFGSVQAGLTVAVLATALLITGRMLQAHRDLLYAGVVVWAFFGIYLKRSTSTEEGSAVVATAALVGIGLLVLGMVVTKIRARR
jgi:hypothetical protein